MIRLRRIVLRPIMGGDGQSGAKLAVRIAGQSSKIKSLPLLGEDQLKNLRHDRGGFLIDMMIC
jgi:hypothetical protein